MNTEYLRNVAKQLVASGKGILAIDESFRTSEKRFLASGVEHTEENRRLYRQLLVTAPEIENYVSGYILFDETIRQQTDAGIPFPAVLSEKGILTGIKVDTGAVDFDSHPGEKITTGLDGLESRLGEYKTLGASFAKWRAVISIGEHIPSEECLLANAQALAEYAAACQQADIVPIVEPEVLMDGDHAIERCYEVTARNFDILFSTLSEYDIDLPGMLLKTSMVVSGADASSRAGITEVAEQTVDCLKKHVPEELAGVVFLSGGQGDVEATAHLQAMAEIGGLPWPLSFSYGRAIQNPAMELWSKDPQNTQAAQAALLHRAKMNSLAAQGKYSQGLENA